MTNEEMWRERLVRSKNTALEPGALVHTLIEGDRTIINVNALPRRYKLAQAYASVRNLEFRADGPIKIQKFREYLDQRGPLARARLSFEEQPRPSFPADEAYRNKRTRQHYPRGNLLILVDDGVYSAIAASINQYVLDVGRDGYWAVVHMVHGGTPTEVRQHLREFNPCGALLVGRVAAPWYEIAKDFHDTPSEFPCDLYYMDTNGTWTDPDGNGKFSGHNGDLSPEIWIGRLWTPTAQGNDAALLNDYFKRNHAFRVGQLGHARSALAFVDDDWQGFGDCALDDMFPAAMVTTYTNPVMTDADLYRSEVNALRSWVQLCAHSSVHSHALRVGNTNEHITTQYFRDVNPPNAHFYNLFCCGPGRFTADDYLAGWYIFDKAGGGKNLGLTAIASAKSGSILYFEDFYQPLGQGKVIGDAFVDWWKARGPDHDDGERSWFYGLALLGDPTLSWWKGAVPQPEQPQPNDVFDHFPRRTEFRWDPVNLTGANYTVEIDAFGARRAGQWAEASGQSGWMYHNLATSTLTHNFVGMQRGRWRVRANIGGTACSWSPWSYFEYRI